MTSDTHDRELSQMLAAGKRVGMNGAARPHVRAALEEYAAAHPVVIHAPLTRLYTVKGGSLVPSPFYQHYHYRINRHMPIIVGILIAVFLGGGTSYAAEGALPGDILYPVKVHVNEQVRVALALSPEARANVETELASRRLEEAQELSARGALATSTALQLKADFDEHEQESRHATESVREHDPELADRLHATIQARIEAKADILKILVDDEDEALATSTASHEDEDTGAPNDQGSEIDNRDGGEDINGEQKHEDNGLHIGGQLNASTSVRNRSDDHEKKGHSDSEGDTRVDIQL